MWLLEKYQTIIRHSRHKTATLTLRCRHTHFSASCAEPTPSIVKKQEHPSYCWYTRKSPLPRGGNFRNLLRLRTLTLTDAWQLHTCT